MDGLPRSDGHGNSSDLLDLIRDPSGQSFLTPFITEVKLGDLDIPPLLVFDCLPPACIFQPLTGVMPSVELNADLVFRVSEVKIYDPVQTLHSNLVIDAGRVYPVFEGNESGARFHRRIRPLLNHTQRTPAIGISAKQIRPAARLFKDRFREFPRRIQIRRQLLNGRPAQTPIPAHH